MDILLIEDETRVADFIRRGLRAEGWNVMTVADGEAGLQAIDDSRFDLVILDWMLPGINGRDLCQRLRARQNFTPVLILSALDAVEDRIQGLKAGADDYMTKPFNFDELIERILALRRRSAGWQDGAASRLLRAGGICFDRDTLTVTVGNRVVELSQKERDLLLFLMVGAGRVYTRERILNAVWGVNEDPLTNVVDVYIARLRRKIGPDGDRIVTLRNVGYRLDAT